MKMSSKMQKHVERLYEAYGKAAEQDLRTLGFQCIADELQHAVAACRRAALLETLAQAEVVVNASWNRLHTQGWDHPAWREAYCLGQICLAFAYTGLQYAVANQQITVDSSHSAAPGANVTPDRSLDNFLTHCKTSPDNKAAPNLATSTGSAAQTEANFEQHRTYQDAMRAVDLALIMGAPSEMMQPFVSIIEPQAKSRLQSVLVAKSTKHAQSNGNALQLSDAKPVNAPQLSSPRSIARKHVHDLSPADFKKLFWKTDTPIIITGDMQTWQAMTKWQSIQWWTESHGHRTVPVELGKDSDSNWKESTLSLHDFMQQYMGPSLQQADAASIAYIAQHPLFEQLPALTTDFQQPSLVAGQVDQSNAWIGTAGTVTPLHFDSYDNFLCQVAGFKYLRLYSRQQTPMLYIDIEKGSTPAKSATRAQRNISAVNIEEPDLKQHPNFAAAQFTECILAPGEMLFIPAKYWHYVRSLSPAVSVNFWY